MRVHKSQRLIDVHLLYQPISQYKVFNLKFTSRKLYSILEANVLNYSASDLQGQYKLNLPEKKYVTSASLSWMKYCAGMGKKSILERKKVMHMMWINPGRQPSTTQQLAHLPPLQLDGKKNQKDRSEKTCGMRKTG